MERFGFDRWRVDLLRPMGMGPGRSSIEVGDGRLRVRMGPFFFMDAPLSAVAGAAPYARSRSRLIAGGVGVHGWRGAWRVNASYRNLVRVELSPAQPARTMGIPLKVSVLEINPDDRDAFLAALERERTR